MRYLLDTHILLWWLSNPSKISTKVKNAIQDPDHQIYVSSVSVWEIAIKQGLKKLKAPSNLLEMIKKNEFDELAVRFEHAAAVEKLANHHNDPFDRLLVAQSIVEKLTFISEDSFVRKYKGLHVF